MAHVLLFVPNVIGYIRILLLLAALALLPSPSPFPSVILYSLSGLLDALDGHAARLLNQSSRFGAVLDMVTDRCATATLMLHLAILYPSYALLFQILIALDFSSHYMQMVATLSSGLTSHKTMRKDTNWMLYLYYTNKIVLFTVCMFNELFFILLYVAAKTELAGWAWNGVWAGIAAVCAFKQVCNVIQLLDASMVLVHLDMKEIRERKERKE